MFEENNPQFQYKYAVVEGPQIFSTFADSSNESANNKEKHNRIENKSNCEETLNIWNKSSLTSSIKDKCKTTN